MSSSEEEPALHHPLLEEVFTLLETAKRYEHNNQRIEAATKYYESCYLMRQILAERNTNTNTDADSSSLSHLLTEKIQFYNTAAQQLYFDDRSTAPTASKPLPVSIGVLSGGDDISVLTTPTTIPTTNNNTEHSSISQTPSSALASPQVMTTTRTITGTVLTTPVAPPTTNNNNNNNNNNNTQQGSNTQAPISALSSPQVVVTTTTEKGIPVPCDEHQLYDMMNRSMKSTRQHSFVAQPHTTPPAETGGGGGKESGRIVYSPTTTKKKRSNSLLFSSLSVIRELSPPTPSPFVPNTNTYTNTNADEYVVVPSVPTTKLSPFPTDNDDEICRRASIANAALQQAVDYDETTQHHPIPTDVIAHYLQAVDLYLQAIHLAEHSSSDSTAFSSPYHLLPKLRRRVQLALDRIEVLKQQQQR